MSSFKGFPEGKMRTTPIPEQFFSDVLPQIDHLEELRVTLYAIWKLDQLEGVFRYLVTQDFLDDEHLMHSLGSAPEQAQGILEDALQRAVQRGVLLRADLPLQGAKQAVYFLNSPKGRAAARAIHSGQWRPGMQPPQATLVEQPNIYRLYEENIGPMTPLLAEALQEAEDTYPADWIEDAMRIAVENNKRNWRYVSAILERWNREGRNAKKTKAQDRRDPAKDGSRYVEGEFSDFIEH
jgi:DnaD/phage-associated family protein